MFVSGFTFIRNALKYDYPIVEAITSILPLCDEVIVLVGNSEDETLALVQSINSTKIKIHHSVWNDEIRKGGAVLADETNKAFNLTNPKADWCCYIQGDEVLHEDGLFQLKKNMELYKDNKQIDGLLFNYIHFYGSYDYVGSSTRWYRNEVRVIRRDNSIRSFKDAQGFQKLNRPLKVKRAEATIHHYGWVKPPELQQAKQQSFHKLWHSDGWVKNHVGTHHEFDYSAIDSLKKFEGNHPKVIQPRIANQNWYFKHDIAKNKLGLKAWIKLTIEKYTGWLPGEYKNYRLF
jgi:glycosyltransferase involved in cell wall biosynthesis